MIKLSRKKLHFERLEVDVDLALEIFQDNKYKFQQIPEIAQSSVNGRTICMYRIGDFIDISKGPMMTHTGHLNKCTITAVHPLPQCNEISETLYRLQGVALPSGFLVRLMIYIYGFKLVYYILIFFFSLTIMRMV
jgi:large subunit ribosomal protein L39